MSEPSKQKQFERISKKITEVEAQEKTKKDDTEKERLETFLKEEGDKFERENGRQMTYSEMRSRYG